MNQGKSKHFIITFTLVSLVLLILVGLFVYVVDPFFRYRIKDKSYILNPLYVNPGLIKNYDYNTVILGSSMVQNYDLNILRKNDEGLKPLKLGSGAMTISEMEELYTAIDKDSVDLFILNMDIIQFNEWSQNSKYPDYLFSSKFLDVLRYHYAYESTIRYGITDVVLLSYLNLYDYTEIPDKLKYRISIDNIGNFKYDATFHNIENIKHLFFTRANLSYPNIPEMEDRIKNNIKQLFEVLNIDKYPSKKYILILPPYSVLYWSITQIDLYYPFLREGIIYLINEASKYPNVEVQCFYTIPEITDLNYYSDVSHFSPEISNFILENINNISFRADSSNIDSIMLKLDTIISEYRKDNNWAN